MSHSFELRRFRIVKLPNAMQQEFDLPVIICADPDGLPFLEGQSFYVWLIDKNGCQPITAHTYLKAVLQFLTFLWFRSPPQHYTAPVPHIRDSLETYLKEKLGCSVRPHTHGNLLVTGTRTVTRYTIRLYLAALRRFYDHVIEAGWYPETHPLNWEQGIARSERSFQPKMPPQSGMTLPDPPSGRMPATYFCVTAEQWRPKIIDDPSLPQQVITGLAYQRDHLITRILFESGARISEVLGLTVGDWQQLRGQRHGALATNKGSWGQRVKEIWWSSATSQQLQLYINGDRRQTDPLRRQLEELPDAAPLFISEKGEAYRYPAFYYHWRKACRQVGLKLHPHQARHWFVTMALRRIQALPEESLREGYRQGLIGYMHWKSPETIQVYDHHLRVMDFTAVHLAISQLVEVGSELLTSSPIELMPQATVADIPSALWERLTELLDGVEEVI